MLPLNPVCAQGELVEMVPTAVTKKPCKPLVYRALSDFLGTINGGGGGNRTRVREQVLRDHYVRSQSMLRLSRPHQLRLTGSGLDQF